MPNNVTVQELVDKVRLKVLQGEDYLQRKITTSDISRPALEFAGYFKHYPAARIQLLGITETSFAKDLTHEQREEYMTKMCMPQTPCFVISTNLPIPKELKKAAEDAKIPILGTHLTSSQILSNMTSYLLERLAPRKSLHGVLVDISGVGVLITGDSGVGKSETALELVRRGHRLIADDRVEVYARDEQTLVGTAPQILKHLMEIRGIGIIDVSTLYGTGAIMPSDQINLTKVGPYKIKSNLEKLKIDKEIIEEVMATLNDDLIHENLVNIVLKKSRLNNHYSLFQLKTKLKLELTNMGYETNDINDVLNKYLTVDDNIAKKEYEKLKKKYEKKYQGKELEFKLKQAMYQKGFSISE